jgi:hypothetical protein
MENSLANKKPWLVAEWSERNGSISPDDVPYGSKKLYWWHGSCGHEWQASAKARSSGEYCPICSNARIVAGINRCLYSVQWKGKLSCDRGLTAWRSTGLNFAYPFITTL